LISLKGRNSAQAAVIE